MNKIIKVLAIICLVSCLACLVACDQVDETDPTALKPFAAPDPNNPYDEKIPRDDISGNRDNFFDNTLTLLFTNTESLNNLFHDFVPEDFPGLDIKAVREVLVGEVERIRQQVLLGDKYKGSKVPSVETYNRWIEIEFNFNDYDKLAEAQELLYPRSEFRGVSPRSKGGSWFEAPNDTNYSSQQQNIADLIDLEEAWDHTTGSSSVKVGVLDTGIMGTHSDLIDNLDFDSGYANSYSNLPDKFTDEDGHGTSVAGIIGAVGDNEIGISGVCWDVSLVSLKVAEYIQTELDVWKILEHPSYLIQALQYASDDETYIPILSFSGGWYESDISGIEISRVRNAIAAYPGLLVCAAGNSNINLDAEGATKLYPACIDLPNILVVGATNDNGSFWASSNYGQTSVDIFAPGVTIYTTAKSGSYTTITGTSAATPFVAGVAALLLSYDPTLTTAELKSAILDGSDSVASLSGKCVTGGILNALGAIKQKHQEKNGYDYTNISLGRGHICTCSECDYTFERNHTWTPFGDFFKCVYCLALSTIIEDIHPLTLSGRYQLLLQQAALAATDSSYYSVDIDEHSSIIYYKGNYFIVAECDENGSLLYDIPDSVLAEGYVIRNNEVVLEDGVPDTEIA